MPHPQQARIVLVGLPGTGRRSILSALRCASSGGDGHYCLPLDTKYYRADVEVGLLEPHHQAAAWVCPDGLVLVADVTDKPSYEAVKEWAAKHDYEAAEVRLLVANKTDKRSSGQLAWHTAAMDWCIDNGFEYIEAAAGAPEADALLSTPHDQQGMARIRAALEANMWPGMEQKSAPSVRPNCQYDPTHSSPGVSEAASASHADAPHRDPPPPSAAATAGARASNPPDQDSKSASREAGGGPADPDNPFAANLKDPTDVAPQDRNEAGLMASITDFENMMSEMKRVREAASHMPDGERRAYVAAMVTKMAGLMGLEDDSDAEQEQDAL